MLGALEDRRRGQPLKVIGVHSAKFDAERAPERIAEAMARYGVHHPVIVDEGHRIWRAYAVRSWPTLVVIRPDGTLAAVAPGEADLDALDAFVGRLLDEARGDGTLAAAPLDIGAPSAHAPGPLAFPGKVVALPDGGLVVADSGHHRVLVLSPDGVVRHAIGSGEPGLVDGPLKSARFRDPHGLAVRDQLVFIADTGNHAIRVADLGRGLVGTLAGTGALGRGVPRGSVPARDVALRSPWDLALAGDYLLIAMAGAHQIWAMSLEQETLAVLAGNGREALDDGTFAEATFAQPSGLALAGERLYLADSETSSVRYLDLTEGQVRTLVGKGLFDFGDRDGPAREALLQHPIGISHGPAGLLVADSYNDKIKRVDVENGDVSTFFAADGDLTLREPAGLCQLADGRVIVADTNRHRLVAMDPDGRRARVVDVSGAPEAEPSAPAEPAEGAETLRTVDAGLGGLTLRLRLALPDGYALSEGSRVALRIAGDSRIGAPSEDQGFAVSGPRSGVPVRLTAESPGDATLDIQLEAVLCGHGDAAACWPVERRYLLPLRIREAAPPAIEAALRLPDPLRT